MGCGCGQKDGASGLRALRLLGFQGFETAQIHECRSCGISWSRDLLPLRLPECAKQAHLAPNHHTLVAASTITHSLSESVAVKSRPSCYYQKPEARFHSRQFPELTGVKWRW